MFFVPLAPEFHTASKPQRALLVVCTLLLLAACKSERMPAVARETLPSPASAPGQPDDVRADTAITNPAEYVAQVFVAQTGGPPRMGWLVPPNRLLAEERQPELIVYATGEVARRATFSRVVPPEEHRIITRTHYVACESDSALVEYKVASQIQAAGRVLYTSRPFPAAPRAGTLRIALSPAQIAQVSALLGWPADSRPRLHEAVGVGAGLPFYSIHALYDSTTGELVHSALVLHDSRGSVIARSVRDATAYGCDGCGIPTYSDGLRVLYFVMNIYSFPSFPYPVLLLDTSTIEGRALSLLTFTPAGKEAEYRVYEYVVNCILSGRP